MARDGGVESPLPFDERWGLLGHDLIWDGEQLRGCLASSNLEPPACFAGGKIDMTGTGKTWKDGVEIAHGPSNAGWRCGGYAAVHCTAPTGIGMDVGVEVSMSLPVAGYKSSSIEWREAGVSGKAEPCLGATRWLELQKDRAFLG